MMSIFVGVSTKAEVELICKRFPDLKPGDEITYDEIEAITGVKREAGRFKSITTALKKRLSNQHNIELDCIANRGYVVQNNSQRVDTSSRKMKQGIKRIVKSGDIAQRTDSAGLTDAELRIKDHLVRVRGAIVATANQEARKIKFEIKQIGEGR